MSHGNRWETFARENAEYFILTEIGRASDSAAMEEFFESGRKLVGEILNEVADQVSGRDLAIEIGCGVGRLLIPMARQFTQVIGVDIAPTMLAKLRSNCQRLGVQNARGMLTDEPWDQGRQADFAYSWLVFQHIVDFPTIERSVRQLTAALKCGGVALLQFDTRRASFGYRLRNALPDAVLPRPWRRGIRRIRRSPQRLALLFDAAGLGTIVQRGAGTDQHIFILRKA